MHDLHHQQQLSGLSPPKPNALHPHSTTVVCTYPPALGRKDGLLSLPSSGADAGFEVKLCGV